MVSEGYMFLVPGKHGSKNRKLRAHSSATIMKQKEQTGRAARLLTSKPSLCGGFPLARLHHLNLPPTKKKVPPAEGDCD